MSSRALRGVGLAVGIFVLVQLGALALVPEFAGDPRYETVEDPTDPTNSLLYIGAILVMTVLMLAAFKYDFDKAVKGVIVFTSGLLSWYVFSALLPTLPALALSAAVPVALVLYPEWYVIDAAGVLMGAGAAGLFGVNFGLLPAVVLLVALAVYDAISVYGTEHMLDLAEGVMDLRIPVVLVIPLTLSYSVFDDGTTAEVTGADEDDGARSEADGSDPDAGNATDTDGGPAASADSGKSADEGSDDEADDEMRDVFFVGLGDAVMPTVMVASAAAFASWAPSLGVPGLAVLNLPALLSMVGTLLGLLVLLRMVLKGRAHAGLPLLNGGAVGGYLLGALLTGASVVQALGLAPYL
jgi:presenilin-like A22 family membrane protease